MKLGLRWNEAYGLLVLSLSAGAGSSSLAFPVGWFAVLPPPVPIAPPIAPVRLAGVVPPGCSPDLMPEAPAGFGPVSLMLMLPRSNVATLPARRSDAAWRSLEVFPALGRSFATRSICAREPHRPSITTCALQRPLGTIRNAER